MRALAPILGRVMGIIITLLLVLPAGSLAQEAGDFAPEYKFSKEELTQMLAPIALYPDALTAQILMASTYPLEVVEAERWRSQNLHLKGNDLDKALQEKDWEPSVKSLCHFPDILKAMSDKLDQTRKLGDAFLGQEEEVMTTVQELRRKAMEEGNLKATNEQKVRVENDKIMIEPANPEVVYVPVYDPAYVYGPWWYPAYPPYYWYYPPRFYGGAFISFGPAIFFGYNAFSWVWFDWSVHVVHIDINRTRSFHRHVDSREDVRRVWRHNPRHRKGVTYRDLRTSERFGAREPRVSIPDRPGRGERIEPPDRGAAPSPSPGVRQIVPQTPRIQTPAVRPSTPETRRDDTVTPRGQSGPGSSQRPQLRETPIRGDAEEDFERPAGERGGRNDRDSESGLPLEDSSDGQTRQGPGGRGSGGGSRDGEQEKGSGSSGSRGGGQDGDSRRER